MSKPREIRGRSQATLIKWLIGIAVALAALHLGLVLFFGIMPAAIVVLPWYVPTVHVFVALAALSVAFLGFGRYLTLRDTTSFWIATAFSTFAIFAVFYILSYPGLLPGDRGLISSLLNTASWFWHLKFSVLALFLLLAVLTHWPHFDAARNRWLFLLPLAIALVSIAIGWVSIALEESLPILVVDGDWTPFNVGWIYAIMAAFAVGTALSARRYRQTGDTLLGYAAITQIVLAFAMLTGILSGRFYNVWWYWQRILWIGGFSVMLFGLLSDYALLYRRERERSKEAEDERNRLKVLIDTAPIGIMFCSEPDGRPTLFNKAAEKILGKRIAPEIGIAGQPAYFGIHRPNGDPFPADELPVSRSLRGETCTGIEMLIRRADGSEAYVIVNSAPLHDEEGRITGAVVAFQDITQIKEQERLRDEFIDAAAHELKTPVATIKGYAQLMRKWVTNGHAPQEAQALAVIDDQCNRINRRVEEMLLAVRYRGIPSESRLVRFDVGELALDVVRRMQAETKSHRLLVGSERPVSVEADKEGIEGVLMSLIESAIKYSPKGGIIEVRVGVQQDNAVVSVKNPAASIPQERRAHIFEPFFEPVPTGLPGYSGVVALSLYISRLIVESHGGRVWFEGGEGEGATFYFSLPIAKGGANGAE